MSDQFLMTSKVYWFPGPLLFHYIVPSWNIPTPKITPSLTLIYVTQSISLYQNTVSLSLEYPIRKMAVSQ
jgi:hypothetical protein